MHSFLDYKCGCWEKSSLDDTAISVNADWCFDDGWAFIHFPIFNFLTQAKTTEEEEEEEEEEEDDDDEDKVVMLQKPEIFVFSLFCFCLFCLCSTIINLQIANKQNSSLLVRSCSKISFGLFFFSFF